MLLFARRVNKPAHMMHPIRGWSLSMEFTPPMDERITLSVRFIRLVAGTGTSAKLAISARLV